MTARPRGPVATTVSTHALDAERGGGAAGVLVRLARRRDGGLEVVAEATTDAAGRATLADGDVVPGDYEVRFDLAGYSAARGTEPFLVELTAVVRMDRGRYHLPVLVATHAATVYRGSA